MNFFSCKRSFKNSKLFGTGFQKYGQGCVIIGSQNQPAGLFLLLHNQTLKPKSSPLAIIILVQIYGIKKESFQRGEFRKKPFRLFSLTTLISKKTVFTNVDTNQKIPVHKMSSASSAAATDVIPVPAANSKTNFPENSSG